MSILGPVAENRLTRQQRIMDLMQARKAQQEELSDQLVSELAKQHDQQTFQAGENEKNRAVDEARLKVDQDRNAQLQRQTDVAPFLDQYAGWLPADQMRFTQEWAKRYGESPFDSRAYGLLSEMSSPRARQVAAPSAPRKPYREPSAVGAVPGTFESLPKPTPSGTSAVAGTVQEIVGGVESPGKGAEGRVAQEQRPRPGMPGPVETEATIAARGPEMMTVTEPGWTPQSADMWKTEQNNQRMYSSQAVQLLMQAVRDGSMVTNPEWRSQVAGVVGNLAPGLGVTSTGLPSASDPMTASKIDLNDAYVSKALQAVETMKAGIEAERERIGIAKGQLGVSQGMLGVAQDRNRIARENGIRLGQQFQQADLTRRFKIASDVQKAKESAFVKNGDEWVPDTEAREMYDGILQSMKLPWSVGQGGEAVPEFDASYNPSGSGSSDGTGAKKPTQQEVLNAGYRMARASAQEGMDERAAYDYLTREMGKAGASKSDIDTAMQAYYKVIRERRG